MIDASSLGHPGFKLTLWGVTGWGADASAGAARSAAPGNPLNALYWKNGQPVHGSHHELVIYPSYVVQSGPCRGTRFALVVANHHGSRFYADNSIRELKLVVDMPLMRF